MSQYLNKRFFRLLVIFLGILVLSLVVNFVITGGYGFAGV